MSLYKVCTYRYLLIGDIHQIVSVKDNLVGYKICRKLMAVLNRAWRLDNRGLKPIYVVGKSLNRNFTENRKLLILSHRLDRNLWLFQVQVTTTTVPEAEGFVQIPKEEA